MEIAKASFPPTLRAPGDSRAFVREVLGRRGLEELIADAELLTSELVTNIVKHGRPPIELDVSDSGSELRIEARDGSSILPALRDTAGTDGGFGLRLLDELAERWGVTERSGGKVVWFTLAR